MIERTPPDSPHVRSGVSSFSHISSPTSYQFSRDGDASDEEGSSWSSDEVLCSGIAVTPFTHLYLRHALHPAVARHSVLSWSAHCGMYGPNSGPKPAAMHSS